MLKITGVFLCAGGLSLAVEGPSKTEIKCIDNQDGTCTVSYLPTVPGEYLITVKFADKNIMGSPFTAKVTREFTLDSDLGGVVVSIWLALIRLFC